ncbi:MAG: hypothetical protein JOY90_36090 [Bradyrhizobium sp.]|uniref:hypothetical protein n=1 Tax=Bradyrhizobium sp. TaxID=376 RepID=UPI001E105D1C|nr:hypothetical protein [Bradyrhizobium sp.]MBV9565836.1 hypothetical protein [Bradyrhizobium sp.]
MRSALILGVLIALTASASAASARHSRGRHVIVAHRGQAQRAPIPERRSFAVPGWTEEETLRWMNDATAYP